MNYETALKYIRDNMQLAISLCQWFEDNARELPWRKDRDPYHIWISEIMLQQTRVEAVKAYYMRFMEELPTIQNLAECSQERYLKLWEGLGYYSRVRNLHEAAVTVMQEHGGNLPADYDQLLKLKGIGSYTAGAIASQAFELRYPSVDGNVLRVMMRLLGCEWDIAKSGTKKQVENLIQNWLDREEIRPGTLNQALMELGATVCVPNGKPHCESCPWRESCMAYRELTYDMIPVKTSAKARRIEEKTVFVLQNQEGIFFHRRPENGLLAGLYEFPNTEGHLSQEDALTYVKNLGYHPIRIRKIQEAKHIFSHVEWHMTGYAVLVEEMNQIGDCFFVDVETAKRDYAIPAAFRVYKQYIGAEVE